MKKVACLFCGLLLHGFMRAEEVKPINIAVENSVDGGTIIVIDNQNGTATLTAQVSDPNKYEFWKWTDGETSISRTVSKSADKDDKFSAMFKLKAMNNEEGKVAIDFKNTPSDLNNPTSFVFTMTAIPNTTVNSCSKFQMWSDGKTDISRDYTLSQCEVLPSYYLQKMQGKEANTYAFGTLVYTDGECQGTITATPKTGYVFYQWEDECINREQATRVVDYDATSYRAQFIPANVIQFNVGAHSSTVVANATGVQREAPEITVDDHYTLEGWADSNSATSPNVTFPYFCQNTLYAVYSAIEYTISFNVDSKATAIDDLIGTVEDPIVLPTPETMNGWKFLGWKLNNEGELLEAGSDFYPQANGMMYGQFTEATPAEISGVAYNSIADAMAAAQETDVIDIMMNTTENITILAGQTYTINGNAKALTGDIIIKKGGKLTLNGDWSASDLYLEGTKGISSQLIQDEAVLSLSGNAYFDYTLVRDGEADSKSWYGFAVPFSVNVAGGIYPLGSNTAAVPEQDIRITQFNGTDRAKTGAGWTKNYLTSGTLEPGQFYMMTINGTTNTWRFKSANGSLPTATSIQLTDYTASGAADIDKGWNGVANPMLCYVNATTSSAQKAYIYNNAEGSYQAYPLSEYSFVVGCPLFIQVGENPETIDFVAGDRGDDYRFAPSRVEQSPKMNCTVMLNSNGYTDYLYLSASYEATTTYQRGRDLQKLISAQVPQLWSIAYGVKLAAEDAKFVDDEAVYYLELNAPKTGSYTLSVKGMNGMPLYLLDNGQIVWNLTEADYELVLPQGVHDNYMLQTRVQRGMSTEINNLRSMENGQSKFIYQNNLYIMRGSALFNAQGKKIK